MKKVSTTAERLNTLMNERGLKQSDPIKKEAIRRPPRKKEKKEMK